MRKPAPASPSPLNQKATIIGCKAINTTYYGFAVIGNGYRSTLDGIVEDIFADEEPEEPSKEGHVCAPYIPIYKPPKL